MHFREKFFRYTKTSDQILDGKFWALQPGFYAVEAAQANGMFENGARSLLKGPLILDEFPDFYFVATLYGDNLRYNHLVRMICAKNISPTSYFRSFWINCLAKDLFKLTLLDKVAGNHEVFLGKEKEPEGSFVHPVPQMPMASFLKTSPPQLRLDESCLPTTS